MSDARPTALDWHRAFAALPPAFALASFYWVASADVPGKICLVRVRDGAFVELLVDRFCQDLSGGISLRCSGPMHRPRAPSHVIADIIKRIDGR